jgi:ribose transport system substrate-binding protein
MSHEHGETNQHLTRRRALQIGGAGAFASVLAACGSSGDSSSSAAQSKSSGSLAGDGEEYMWGLYLSTIPYWSNAQKGLDDIAKALNVKFKKVGTPTADAPAEVQAIEQGLNSNVAGLVVCAAEDQVLAPLINKQVEAGTPVVTMDAAAPSSKALSHIGTSNVQAGLDCGRRLIEAMGGSGDVLLTRATTVSAFAQREAGFRQAVEETKGKVKLAAVINDYDQSDKAVQSVGQAIQANPNVKGVMTLSAGAGLGTVQALQDANRDEVFVGVFSNDAPVYEMTKKNERLFAVAQDGYKHGFFAGLFLHIAAKKVSTPNYGYEELGLSTLPPSVDTGVNFVDGKNADSFIAGAK